MASEIPGYMTVPEKIELADNSGPMGYHPPGQPQYQPMKVSVLIQGGCHGERPARMLFQIQFCCWSRSQTRLLWRQATCQLQLVEVQYLRY